MKWSYPQIDDLTLPDVTSLYEYWKDWPPENELRAIQVGYEAPLTMEEKIQRGSMGPEDFLEHYKSTRGRLN